MTTVLPAKSTWLVSPMPMDTELVLAPVFLSTMAPVPGCTGSLKLSVRLLPGATLVALGAGARALRVGAVVSPLTVLSSDLSVSLNCTNSTLLALMTSPLVLLVSKVSSLLASVVMV